MKYKVSFNMEISNPEDIPDYIDHFDLISNLIRDFQDEPNNVLGSYSKAVCEGTDLNYWDVGYDVRDVSISPIEETPNIELDNKVLKDIDKTKAMWTDAPNEVNEEETTSFEETSIVNNMPLGFL